ncbi:MAG: SurA N-terminal domain-containing protein [Candidatus Omnitrophota bacterium]
MKRILIIILAVLMIAGCKCQAKDKQVLARINNYEITKQEFDEEFKDSAYGVSDTEESRKSFLENLINRKLVLQEAQRQGLDKDKAFLKSIERFWEQSLLKVMLDKKSKDVSLLKDASKREVEDAYDGWIDGMRKNSDIKIEYNLLK